MTTTHPAAPDGTVEPFVPTVDDAVLEDLRERLRRTRWPDQVEGSGWDLGTDTAWLRSFCTTWAEEFSWAEAQARLEAHENLLVHVDGLRLHVLRERGTRAPGVEPLPLVLLHGWPSSFVQMLPVVGPLAHPERYGGDPADAFDVVALSLPGYGFSDRPRERGWDVARTARALVRVMSALGHERFAARGSDLGAGVLQQLALREPERLAALHLSGTNPWIGQVPGDLTDAEREFVQRAQQWSASEMAYAAEHATKPQTLAHALNDSPAGLASWVLEKFRTWSDCGGDLDSVYERADLLTNLTVYWATQTIGSSVRLYAETARSTTAAWGRVEVPTGMAMSAADMFPTPREWAERSYRVTSWTELERGGHFLEQEVPDLVVADVRRFFAGFR
ncbi:epoxide hydrolase family protein [Kineococcus terrestris]|uniref:epoxide hydrolase family protein n=1 Tax=Kineococcus terrestris TaxID=2044856 RepID=UPI0034DABDB1